MKKIFLCAVLAVVMAFGISCSKEEPKVDTGKAVEKQAAPVQPAMPAPTVKKIEKVEAPDVQPAAETPKIEGGVKAGDKLPQDEVDKAIKTAPVAVFKEAAPTDIPVDPNKEYIVAWSHYTTWELMSYLEQSGILAKWAEKYGIKVKLQYFDYVPSLTAYTSDENIVGCVMTNMDALISPVSGGVASVVIIVQDYSNGNDGIVGRGLTKVSELKGKELTLVDGSVSTYLVYRALDIKGEGVTAQDIKFNNVTQDSVLATVYVDNASVIAATWNPILMQLRQVPGTNVLFTSAEIPGEILDLLVVKATAPTALNKALTGAWYEAITNLTAKGPMRDEVLAAMAKSAGNGVPEIKAQLDTTFMYYTPASAVEFTNGAKLKETMEFGRKYYFESGLLKVPNKDFIGIAYPDGTVQGDPNNVQFRYTSYYMQLAADGAL